MGYTAPTTRATGDFITASIWNTDLVNNITYLKGIGGLNYTQFTSNVASTATTQATATTVVTAGAITFDGVQAAMIEFYAPAWTGSITTADCVLTLYKDGTALTDLWKSRATTASVNLGDISGMYREVPAAGSHTYSIRAWIGAAGTFTVTAGAGTAGALAPGFIEVSTTL